jgi:hypothetical protein
MEVNLSVSGGDEAMSYLQKLREKLDTQEGLRVRVGLLEGSTCGHDNDAPAPEVAFWNEFGTHTSHPIPARPFFRTTISRYSATWGRLVSAALKHADFDGKKALAIVGMKIQGQIQRQIEETVDPPNAPSTIKGKGFNKPLEDSKNMKRAVNFEVASKPTEHSDL